ncbi:MAG TPA: hypothetical protein VNQ77_19295 [Frankiaceae bacterium]|nr:hypothetical protein [Frankiaceae bacterium]
MRIARALLAVALLATPVVVRAEAAQPRFRALELVRIRPGGPGAVEVLVHSESDDDRAMVAVVPLRRAGRGWEVPALIVAEEGPKSTVRAYGTPAPQCPPPQGCAGGDGESVFMAALSVRSGIRNFVVSDYATTTAAVSGTAARYWRFRPVRLGVQRMLAEQSGVGVRYLGTAVERFSSATAAGGRYGSVAFAAGPCAGAFAGSARLEGGTAPREVCPGGPEAFAVAPGETLWRFTGEVIGTTGFTTRLLVVDFPRP